MVIIHGLNSDQYSMSDMAVELRLRPGFLDRYQIAYFNYPTGIAFLRSAAILRRDLHALAATFDPSGADAALRETTLVAYSMGGLVAKTQVVSSGDSAWALWSRVPLDALGRPERRGSLARFAAVEEALAIHRGRLVQVVGERDPFALLPATARNAHAPDRQHEPR